MTHPTYIKAINTIRRAERHGWFDPEPTLSSEGFANLFGPGYIPTSDECEALAQCSVRADLWLIANNYHSSAQQGI